MPKNKARRAYGAGPGSPYNLKTHVMLALVIDRRLREKIRRLCEKRSKTLRSFVYELLSESVRRKG